ncbi:hypothetical protein BZL29_8447 [Mycobacterium kansasii]|uniref:Uncharacterized protein n=1 Tax=Mycobacterium kansasii TaxID=1768 RepID=A0A1V3WBY1_MYCKA|nr:hypothetical protein BZL29_8447 [Mycobacterium kansasii]
MYDAALMGRSRPATATGSTALRQLSYSQECGGERANTSRHRHRT